MKTIDYHEPNTPAPGTYQVQEKNGKFYIGIWVQQYISNGWFRRKIPITTFERLACTDLPYSYYRGHDSVPPPLHAFSDLEQAKSYARRLKSKQDNPKPEKSKFHNIV